MATTSKAHSVYLSDCQMKVMRSFRDQHAEKLDDNMLSVASLREVVAANPTYQTALEDLFKRAQLFWCSSEYIEECKKSKGLKGCEFSDQVRKSVEVWEKMPCTASVMIEIRNKVVVFNIFPWGGFMIDLLVTEEEAIAFMVAAGLPSPTTFTPRKYKNSTLIDYATVVKHFGNIMVSMQTWQLAEVLGLVRI